MIAGMLSNRMHSLIVWQQHIVHFADVQGAVLDAYTTWWQTGNGLMESPPHLFENVHILTGLFFHSAGRKYRYLRADVFPLPTV